MAVPAPGAHEKIPEAEIAMALSRVLGGLFPSVPGFSDVLSRVQQGPFKKVADLHGVQFSSFVLMNGGAELLKAAAEQSAKIGARDEKDNRLAAGAALVAGGFGRFIPGQGFGGADKVGNGSGSAPSSNAQGAKWALEGTPISNATGLSTATYAQLRGEGYSQAQIAAAAGDLSKIRGFTPADVDRYTPYFAGTDSKFRAQAKRVIESNGKLRFHEDDKLGNALPQVVLAHDGKIQPNQMNSVAQALDALKVSATT